MSRFEELLRSGLSERTGDHRQFLRKSVSTVRILWKFNRYKHSTQLYKTPPEAVTDEDVKVGRVLIRQSVVSSWRETLG